jgi:hypothetical protein
MRRCSRRSNARSRTSRTLITASIVVDKSDCRESPGGPRYNCPFRNSSVLPIASQSFVRCTVLLLGGCYGREKRR